MFSAVYPPADRPFIRLDGFKVCTCLNHATFFTDLDLDLPSGETTFNSTTAAEFVQLIDYTARKLLERSDRVRMYQRQAQVTANVTVDFAVRGMCYTLAQGFAHGDDWPVIIAHRPWEVLSKKYAGRLLRTIDSQSALPFLNYASEQPPDRSNSDSKPHYNLAYVILVHNNPKKVEALVDALSDPTVFIYLHIDLSAPDSFKTSIRKLAKSRQNIAIMPTEFAISWGHISLLWVEFRAFFDLLDLIDFDYVINLSGSDYPLKSAKTIYQHLERRPGSNWIYWNDGSWQIEHRLDHMFHCTDKTSSKCGLDDTAREWRSWAGLHDLFGHRYKSSQWVILHRSGVEYLRDSEAAKLLLTWAEHTLCPDEMILPILYAASPFVNQTYRDPKRLMRWNGGLHPEDWHSGDKDSIWYWQRHFFWIRKVDVVAEPELKKILDEVRHNDEMWEGAVAPFGGGIVPVD
jgi:hypothetical protein